MKLTDYHQIKDVLESARTVLVMGHVNPDVDSLGSQLALYHAMKKSGKKVTAVCPSPVPKHCLYLPGAEEIKMLPLTEKVFDAVFTVDAPDLKRLGKDLAETGRSAKFLINVDHHVSNKKYGTVNLVDEKACASGEIVYELIQSLEIEMDSDIAKCLYAALLTDTNSFKYSTALTHEMAAQMIHSGALPQEASKHIYRGYSLRKMRLLHLALATLETAFEGKTAYLTIERNFYKKTQAKNEDAEGLIEFARSIEGVLIAAIFDEQDAGKYVKVSFRSNLDRYDVNQLAGRFGGGGHAYASGALIEGKAEDVKKQILKEIGRFLKMNFKGLKPAMNPLS